MEQTPTTRAKEPNEPSLRLNKPAPHGVGVQDLRPLRGRPPADPGPRRLIGAPERRRSTSKERSTHPKLGLDRPRSFRNDIGASPASSIWRVIRAAGATRRAHQPVRCRLAARADTEFRAGIVSSRSTRPRSMPRRSVRAMRTASRCCPTPPGRGSFPSSEARQRLPSPRCGGGRSGTRKAAAAARSTRRGRTGVGCSPAATPRRRRSRRCGTRSSTLIRPDRSSPRGSRRRSYAPCSRWPVSTMP